MLTIQGAAARASSSLPDLDGASYPFPTCGTRTFAPTLDQHAPAETWAQLWVEDGSRLGLLVNREGEVKWLSTSVHKALDGCDVLAIRTGRLSAASRPNQDKLDQLLSSALIRSSTVECLFLDNDSNEPRLIARAKAAPGGHEVGLELRTVTRSMQILPNLADLFGLTKAEHDVIARLVNGSSVTEISGQLGKSVLTIRTHMKRSYGKLGISTKEQLFSLILRLLA